MLIKINFDNIKLNNIERILFRELNKGISLTRKGLRLNNTLPRTTIYDNLQLLLDKKLVRFYSKKTGVLGRPYVYWYIPKYVSKEVRERLLKGN